MWRSRGKSTVRIHNTAAAASNFSFSSFKDIQQLCANDNTETQNDDASAPHPSTPRRPSIFHRVRRVNFILRAFSSTRPEPPQPEPEPKPESNASPADQSEPSISIPGASNRIVVYFTSLRVVRSTFEDCRSVRSILRGFRVSIDERDLSMDGAFLEELNAILNQTEKTKLTLPRVFIGGRYVGGAEEIRQLHEAGELKKYVEGLPAAEPGVCEICGGYGFILCDECSGSHKCYTEKGGFRSCTACNENGLIRCPSCSCAPL
ncbi:hypothetical protein RJ639_003881 [Escallonia herrerae]|uniref:Glutaredoxin domain-containing protein n=1 Tax=Escallonia herrerae TaxID=1293975 RepID=A0AA89AXM9_9ASTE|nr:hypothetical protein RJ639_003881 [Escallonia herrerae]